MNGILVCVDYWDYLALTLPYNRHHFEQFIVVTSQGDTKTQEIAADYDCQCITTGAFYRHNAEFNKFAGLEEGLKIIRRYSDPDWLCVMDADVAWPKQVDLSELRIGNLYVPYRRMGDVEERQIPDEDRWGAFDRHRLENYFSGYSQIFHTSDLVLPKEEWYKTNYKTAGGPDTWFSELWKPEKRKRTSFEVLHLGPPATNWCGRASRYLDGTEPEEGKNNLDRFRHYMTQRGINRGFEAERIV